MKNAAQQLINKLPRLKVTFAKLASNEVLVGVPREDAARQSEETGPINNATLAYLHENGAPASNTPARPFMAPGIAAVKPRIIKEFEKAAKSAILADDSAIDRGLNRAGLIAQSSIRSVINSGPPPSLAEGTLAARRRRGRTGTTPLIDTGQLRNSINYVLRKKS
jgi:hypothetical protein